MPANGAREEVGFGCEFVCVVFAEVDVRVGWLVEGEDVGCGFEFGDGYEADLCEMVSVGGCVMVS